MFCPHLYDSVSLLHLAGVGAEEPVRNSNLAEFIQQREHTTKSNHTQKNVWTAIAVVVETINQAIKNASKQTSKANKQTTTKTVQHIYSLNKNTETANKRKRPGATSECFSES